MESCVCGRRRRREPTGEARAPGARAMVSMRLDEWYAKDAAKGKGKGKMDDDEKKAGREAAAPGVGGKLKKSAESLKKALGSSSGDRGSAKEKPKPSASSGIAPNRAPPKPKPKGSPATPPAPRKKKPQKKVDLRAVDLQTRLSGRGTRPGESPIAVPPFALAKSAAFALSLVLTPRASARARRADQVRLRAGRSSPAASRRPPRPRPTGTSCPS